MPFTPWEALYEAFPWNEGVAPPAEVVVCPNQHVVFIDNKKAGSTSVHRLLKGAFGCSWYDWSWAGPPHDDPKNPPRVFASDGDLARTDSRFLNSTIANRYVFFSVVREPVSRFASGLRQARANLPLLANLSTSEYLKLYETTNLDEHTTTQSCALDGADADGRQLPLHFIARLETLQADLDLFFDTLGLPRRDVPWDNVGEQQACEDILQEVTTHVLQVLCAHLMQDFVCFGYELPDACAEKPLRYHDA